MSDHVKAADTERATVRTLRTATVGALMEHLMAFPANADVVLYDHRHDRDAKVLNYVMFDKSRHAVILHLEEPHGPFVRCDLGVTTGSVVPEFYDPMIGKIIASGPTREAARATLLSALRELVVLGIATNREKLIQILESECFRTGRIHTGVLEEIGPLPAEEPARAQDLALILAALEASPRTVSGGSTGWAAARPIAPDPWASASSFRLS